MKKARWIAAAVLILTVLTAGRSNADTTIQDVQGKQLYENACANTSELSDLSVDINLNMRYADTSGLLDLSSDVQVRYTGRQTEELKYLVETITHFPTSILNINQSSFYFEGFRYTNLMGFKFKVPVTLDEVKREIEGNPVTSPFDGANLTDVKVEERLDGTKAVSFVVNTQSIQTEIRSIYNMFGMNALIGKAVFGNMSDTVIISADGFCLYEEVHMPVEQSWKGRTEQADVTITVTYQNPGRPVLLEIPDLNGYYQLDQLELY